MSTMTMTMMTTTEPPFNSGIFAAMRVLPFTLVVACASPPKEVEWPEPPPPTMAHPIGVEEAAEPPGPSAGVVAPPEDSTRGAGDAGTSAAPALPPADAPSDAGQEPDNEAISAEGAPPQ